MVSLPYTLLYTWNSIEQRRMHYGQFGIKHSQNLIRVFKKIDKNEEVQLSSKNKSKILHIYMCGLDVRDGICISWPKN